MRMDDFVREIAAKKFCVYDEHETFECLLLLLTPCGYYYRISQAEQPLCYMHVPTTLLVLIQR